MAEEGERIWLPKVFCIFSPYLFYDKYVEIIDDLVRNMQDGSKGLSNLLEGVIFDIVCRIEPPVRKPINYKGIKI